MKKILPIFLAALLLAGCAAPAEEITYRQINMDEAITMMEEGSGYIILDVRTPEEFAERHIPEPSIYPTKPSARRKSRSCRIKIS